MLTGPRATQFTQPGASLAGADAETVGTMIASAADIALVIDLDGTVQDFAIGAEGIDGDSFADWLGRPVSEILTIESRPKVEELITGARRGDPPRWREVNHPRGAREADFPVRYCAVRADTAGRIMLLGRDLRPMAALQRRLVSIQQSLERDYARLLQMETRYRLLFQHASEAFLIVDIQTGRIIEANPAAGILLGRSEDELLRKRFPLGLTEAGTATVNAMLGTVRASGRPETVVAALAEDDQPVDVFASMFRAEASKHFLVRMTTGPRGLTAAESEVQIVELFRRACEAIVLTDPDGRIEWANDAFLELVQVAVEGQVQGESIDRFFTRQGIDLPLIVSNTREGGRLRFYTTSLSGQHGITTEVEVSSVRLGDTAREGYGFVFRNAALRPADPAANASPLPRSPEQLTELIGRVPLKDLVRETVDVIERLCIEAALRMTDDNRASAADLLGLSRQSLYVKLRRYGLSDPANDPESP